MTTKCQDKTNHHSGLPVHFGPEILGAITALKVFKTIPLWIFLKEQNELFLKEHIMAYLPWCILKHIFAYEMHMKCIFVVIGLAEVVQEQPGPATGLAGMDQAEICINMQELCRKTWKREIYNYIKYAVVCLKYAKGHGMQLYVQDR